MSPSENPPTDPTIHFAEAFSLHEAGQLEEAQDIYRQLITKYPQFADGWHLLGLALIQQNKASEGVPLIEKAIFLNDQAASYYNNLAQGYRQMGAHRRALEAICRALALDPHLPTALNTAAQLHMDKAEWTQAREYLEKAIAVQPDFPQALTNLGILQYHNGEETLSEKNLKASYKLNPNFPETIHGLVGLYNIQRRFSQSRTLCQDFLHRHGEDWTVQRLLAESLAGSGDIEGAHVVLHQMLAKRPDQGLIRLWEVLMLPPVLQSTDQVMVLRSQIEQRLDELTAQGFRLDISRQSGVANFYLAYHGLNDVDLQKKIAAFYLRCCSDLAWVAPHCRVRTGQSSRRLRVGFCSHLLRGHTIGKLFGHFATRLPRDRFEVFVFRNTKFQDPLAKRIDDGVDHVINLPPNLLAARELVAKSELDILFYPDIGMEPLTYFMAFSRLAPVQCVSWGHPVTTGIPNLDYFVSSRRMEIAEADEHYSEKLIRLEGMCYYDPPAVPKKLRRVDLGLPLRGKLYVCPQTLFKIHPDFDPTLRQLLETDSEGYLVLIGGADWTRLLRQRFETTLGEVARRVVYLAPLSQERYLQLLQLADAMIDSRHFGGGNTSYEAFQMDTPIVVWPTDYMRCRVTTGLYDQMGVMDCVAQNANHYVELAIRLAHDSVFRNDMVHQIASRKHRIFRTDSVVEELADFFSTAIEGCQHEFQ